MNFIAYLSKEFAMKKKTFVTISSISKLKHNPGNSEKTKNTESTDAHKHKKKVVGQREIISFLAGHSS